MLAAMAFVVATSVAILRTRALPRAVGGAGFAVAASLAAAWYYLPLFALLAWTATLSLMLAFPLSRPRRAPHRRAWPPLRRGARW
jgi:hypothetical protein